MSAELPRMAGLDGLRAVAAVLVVLTHVGFLTGAMSFGVVGRLLGRGDLGVSIFFALSGFLLYAAMQREQDRTGRVSVGSYYARRAVRVLPAFWLGLAVVCLVVRPGVGAALANLGLTQIYFPDALLPGYTQTWSLATEVSFYLVLPFVFLALRRLGSSRPSIGSRAGRADAVAVLAATWVLGVACAAASGLVEIDGQALAGRWLPAHWSSFALGMLLAEIRSRSAGRAHRLVATLAAYPGTCLTLAFGAYLLATTTVAGPLTLDPIAGVQLAGKEVLGSLVTFGLMAPLLFGSPDAAYAQLLSSGPARYLGRISYGVFLWHLPVFEAIYAVTGIDYFTGGAIALLALGLPVAIGIAAASERFLERPLLAWVHERTRSAPAGVPPLQG
ncbi:acyltransferase family protein [Pedococcus bigeumensis]|uniref:acyltransferase family protein n=1 Tax=Pedococcus bigeumensis TaxID=433644 RepID=UPI001387250D|nr:acyltransferase [Pedococcus bigeumensis]